MAAMTLFCTRPHLKADKEVAQPVAVVARGPLKVSKSCACFLQPTVTGNDAQMGVPAHAQKCALYLRAPPGPAVDMHQRWRRHLTIKKETYIVCAVICELLATITRLSGGHHRARARLCSSRHSRSGLERAPDRECTRMKRINGLHAHHDSVLADCIPG